MHCETMILLFVTGPFSSNVDSKLKNSPDRIVIKRNVNCPSICNVSFFHQLCLNSNKSRHRHIPLVATLNIVANDKGKNIAKRFGGIAPTTLKIYFYKVT